MRVCCISLGVNSPSPPDHPKPLFQDFSEGLRRIQGDLKSLGFPGDVLLWDQTYPDGSPTQSDAHGAFKPFCFKEAFRLGYDVAIWMDASIRIIRKIDPLVSIINREGYLIFEESHSLGQFCKDDALEPLGVGREESFSLPCCWSCVLGLDRRNESAMLFLNEWIARAADGITFAGPKWSGVMGWPPLASSDRRVMGHRHDQTAASAIAIRLGMTKWRSKSFFSNFFHNSRESVRIYDERYK